MIDPEIVAVAIASKTDNSGLQFISKDRLEHLEAVECAAINLVEGQMQLTQAYRCLTAIVQKEVPE